jgi:hypothetical protein
MHRKIFVETAKSGDEMILEGLDCSFRSIALVTAGGHKLEIDTFFGEKCFELRRTFIVEPL